MAIDRVTQRNAMGAPSLGTSSGASAADGEFATLLQPAARAASPAGAEAAASLAFVQAEVEDIFARQKQDREARRHGRAMLKALGGVQLALLGTDPERAREALADLATTAEDATAGDDPLLRLILREIAIRAAVELARNDTGAT